MGEHISLTVNGERRELDVEPRRLLVQAIREDLDLTGTHVGCDTSQCGACTVHLDGMAVKSCTMLAVQADGASVTTIEGMADRRRPPSAPDRVLGEARPPVRVLHPGHDHDRGRSPRPRHATRPTSEIRHALEGNICRCTGYHNIVAAIREAAAMAMRDGRRRAGARRRQRVGRGSTTMTDVLDAPTPLGQPIKRTEDPRFITGKGRYLDDIKLQSMTHMAILRSPYAHANIRSIDTSAAKAMPGVLAVFVGADIPYNPLPMAWPAGGSAGHPEQHQHARVSSPRTASSGPARASRRSSPRPQAQAQRRARSGSRSTGSRCRRSSTPRRRSQAGAPQLHENAPNNVVFEWTVGDKAGTDAAIDGAEVVVRQRIVNQRLIPNPMETRGDIGWYNPGTDEYTVWMSSQTPHIQRLLLTAFVTGIPEHKVRCISPDVGGAFGTKIFCYADMALCMFASKAIGGRPVKWVEGRRENYQSTIHGRDHITYLEIAGTRDGEVTGLRVKTLANLGGRLSTIGPGIPTTLYARVLSGCYKIPNVFAEVTGVYTNTTFVDAYRGAGRPEATYVIERAMDLFAAEIGMDRAELRRTELHPARPVPVREPVRPRHRQRRRQDLHRLGQLRAGDGQGARDGRLRGPRRPRRPRPRPAASSSAWGSRPTSRSAASRRRSGSAPSARAGARRCGSRPTSRST